MAVMQSAGLSSGLSKSFVRALIGGTIILVATCVLLWQTSYGSLSRSSSTWRATDQTPKVAAPSNDQKTLSQWQKPANVKVIGLVFYGRRRFVEILQCYLHVRDCDKTSVAKLIAA